MPEALTQAEIAQVCEFLGIPPTIQWDNYDPDGNGLLCVVHGAGTHYEAYGDKWCQCEPRKTYPNLLSGDGLLLTEKALNEKGYGYMFVRMFKHLDPMVRIEPDGVVKQAPTLPEALARAVLALKEKS